MAQTGPAREPADLEACDSRLAKPFPQPLLAALEEQAALPARASRTNASLRSGHCKSLTKKYLVLTPFFLQLHLPSPAQSTDLAHPPPSCPLFPSLPSSLSLRTALCIYLSTSRHPHGKATSAVAAWAPPRVLQGRSSPAGHDGLSSTWALGRSRAGSL